MSRRGDHVDQPKQPAVVVGSLDVQGDVSIQDINDYPQMIPWLDPHEQAERSRQETRSHNQNKRKGVSDRHRHDDGPELFPDSHTLSPDIMSAKANTCNAMYWEHTNESESIQHTDGSTLYFPPGVIPSQFEKPTATEGPIITASTSEQVHEYSQPGVEYIESSRPGVEYIAGPIGRTSTDDARQANRRRELQGESAHLVNASLVLPVPTVEAKPAPQSRSWKKCLWLGGFAIIIIVLVAVAVKLSRMNAKTASTETRLWEALIPVLPISSKDAIAAKTTSPQYLAFEWLSGDEGVESFTVEKIRQRYALATLFHATSGLQWKNLTGWLVIHKDECDWFSNAINTCSDGVLTILELGGNKLGGHLPPDILILSNLTALHLYDNNLTGPIPSLIGQLSQLDSLYLMNNQFTGPIPSSISQLTNLANLVLAPNALTGTIPSSIDKLTNLVQLDLSTNRLNGTIPSSIGGLTTLDTLDLSPNRLTGPIPSSIGLLTNIKKLYLSQNSLTGPIPSSIGQLTQIEKVVLSNNKLAGSVSPSLNQLTSLVELSLENNELTGTIPSLIRQLTNLVELSFWNNSLTGPIPSTVGELTNLVHLDLSNNTLTGTLPPSMGWLTKLENLDVSKNALTGAIPPAIGQLTSLDELDLSTNKLSGSIPLSISNLTRLDKLYLYQNKLTGQIPEEVCMLGITDMKTDEVPGTCDL